jgi:ABC-type transporter Mla MlaB component
MALTERNGAPRLMCAETIDRSTACALEGIASTLLERTPRSLTLDLEQVEQVDVRGIGVLLQIVGRCYERGVPVDVLASPATGDVAALLWPFGKGARSFGKPESG